MLQLFTATQHLRRYARLINKDDRCPYCGNKVSLYNASLDHLTPRSRNKKAKGKIQEVVLCCRGCNSKKGCLFPIEFFMGCRNKHGIESRIVGVLPFEYQK